MKYDFDKIVDRHGTDCYKWDMIAKRKLPADTLPLWVADMDFETVPEVKERLKEVADRGIYGTGKTVSALQPAQPGVSCLDKRRTVSGCRNL